MVHGGVDSPPLSEKDGAPRWGLPPLYNNFILPTSLLPQVPIIWKAPYIVSFYPQYIINVFNSLASPLVHQKNPFEVYLLQEWPITRQILKSPVIKDQNTKYKLPLKLLKTVMGFSGFIWWSNSFLNGNSLLVTRSVQIIVFSLFSECHIFFPL